ncbi:hypothetical protein RRG08_054359 [Elysia crispata]|uniref:Uncharacterized protein n=1 Tax=Elysia crispata TaxID=231223 RepID=A0AAE1E9W2_9GAST|nr:hypothetical protein RRG08_054359 [Elysia crispata]
MKATTVIAFLLLLVSALAEQKCRKDSHGILRYQGKPCASTTRYDDGHRGACGCGPASSGGFVPGKGRPPSNLNPKIFMVTNHCPIQENFEWCGQSGKPGSNQPNTHGYEVHFDLQNNRGQVSNGLGWDNPECTWERVACPSYLNNYYKQCECS